jgi:ribonuclease BN (tRNA processing enzyme)
MLLDNDILIDAGTGVADLSLTELSLIDHIFLTHSHLDHVASIPFMVDTVGGMRDQPLTLWAVPATLETLRNHIFNWSIWPDFAQIPSPEKPFLRYREIQVGDTVELKKRKLTALPANHVVPAVGYHLDSGREAWCSPATHDQRSPMGGGQQDFQPEVSDYRDRFLQP